MVLKVETPDGDILSLKETIKKNWKHNSKAILLAIGAMIIAILTELSYTLNTILTIGNGSTWLLLLAMLSGTVISTAITITGLLCGVNTQKKADY